MVQHCPAGSPRQIADDEMSPVQKMDTTLANALAPDGSRHAHGRHCVVVEAHLVGRYHCDTLTMNTCLIKIIVVCQRICGRFVRAGLCPRQQWQGLSRFRPVWRGQAGVVEVATLVEPVTAAVMGN